MKEAADAWEIEPGSTVTRAFVAELYGGSIQGGIQPSKKTSNVMVYSDPAVGRSHGYNFDGYGDDGAYYYTGEGQVGDQKIRGGNRAIADHQERCRTLRVFETASGGQPGGKRQRYLGSFEVDKTDPYRYENASDRNGDIRKVIVFRLLPTNAVASSVQPAVAKTSSLSGSSIELVSVEKNVTSAFNITGTDDGEGRRWEAALMAGLEAHLTAQGRSVKRVAIRVAGETVPMLTDTYDVTARELFEVKPTASRAHVRAAVAQLLDYRRHVEGLAHATVLVPVVPARDLRDLIASCGLELAVFHRGDLTRYPPTD